MVHGSKLGVHIYFHIIYKLMLVAALIKKKKLIALKLPYLYRVVN